ncbi:hypothetical protein [Corallococcus exiguus]|uniref:Uncharacterized protein n=1 Tax=Corallococcus exiguus TaxID=83462 RepID=A0A7X5BQM8_9BACT|nr:hypothetical protein [Corallococcus exiguus]NBC40020.1 hypothetical protein [Corallococcus exiguus]TNV60571.1 hypothetical protein FH620_23875 [Corallococcus exiguus]
MSPQKNKHSPADKLINALRGNQDPYSVIKQARETLPPQQYGALLGWIHRNARLAREAFPAAYPKDFNNLHKYPTLPSIPPDQEFIWASTFLQAHTPTIKSFLNKSIEFQRAFLLDNYPLCENILNSIQDEFGQSLWLIKRRLCLLQAAAGLEAQKKYAESVQQGGELGLAGVIAYYVSVRVEPTVTPGQYFNFIKREFESLKIPFDLDSFLQYHAIPDISFSLESTACALRYEFSGTAIDYYEALVCLAPIFSIRAPEQFANNVAPHLATLHAHTGDGRIGGLLAVTGAPLKAAMPIATPRSIAATDALLKGDHQLAWTLANEILVQDPTESDALLTAAQAFARIQSKPERPDGPLFQKIIARLATVITKGSFSTDDVIDLAKRSINFFGDSWASAVIGQAGREISNHPDVKRGDITHYSALFAPRLHPIRAISLPAGGRERAYYLKHLEAQSPASSTQKHVLRVASRDTSLLEHQDDIQRDETLLRSAIQLYGAKRLNEALETCTRLEASNFDYYKRKAICISCRALLAADEPEQCADKITKHFADDRSIFDVLPIAEAAKALHAAPQRVEPGNISIPILFEMTSKHEKGKDDSECVFALLDFLNGHKIKRPSDLKNIKHLFPKSKLIYLLRNVCVESILDRSGLFGSSRALTEERLAICRLLTELDEAELETYQVEAKTLLQKLMLQKRIREVEQSKIYVDTDSIKRTVAEEINESFNRYVALRREKTEQTDSMDFLSMLRKHETGGLQGLFSLALPKNETTSIFVSMVSRLLKEYTLSPEHGLDKYLSVRIRHGTLAAHLRKPVDAAKLVSSRDIGSKGYKSNNYWADRLQLEDPKLRQAVAALIADFSEKFDHLVDEIKSWIQVRTNDNPNGFFDFPITDLSLKIMSEYVTPEVTADRLVDFIIEHFNSILDDCLSFLSGHITDIAKTRASALLDELEAKAEKLNDHHDFSEMTNAIRVAKTETRVAFDRVSTWFRRANTTENDPFQLADAIRIGIETVKIAAPNIAVDIPTQKESSLTIPGRSLATLADIFFIIFENIARHACLDRPTASVSFKTNGVSVYISVENELGHDFNLTEATTRISAIRADLKEGRHVASVSREGGTGFHKLAKLLDHDLGVIPDLDFGFTANSRFSVVFGLPIYHHENTLD